VQPESGEVALEGRPFSPRTKSEAEEAGIIMVLQELNLFGTLSIAENLFLNRLPRRVGFVQAGALRQQATEALARVGLGQLDPICLPPALGVGQQQLVEIAGALAQNCRLLILDEPTAALTGPEIDRPLREYSRAARAGRRHYLHQPSHGRIRRIASRVTVLRDGCRVATHPAAETTTALLVREMAGHDLPDRPPQGARAPGAVALRVTGLRAGTQVRGVDLEVHQGRDPRDRGSDRLGRTETLRAIFGADRAIAGEIELHGKRQPRPFHEPAEAVRAGVGLVPEDRKRDGLLLPQSIRMNATLATVGRDATAGGWIQPTRETATAHESCSRLDVRCASLEQPIAELSGGNQQKVVIARWLPRKCDVILFDEPTRGIDAASKDAIYDLLRELAGEGKAILVVSSELPELMTLSHRIAVMSAGRSSPNFSRRVDAGKADAGGV
jgi:ribose transport system ATP-binding protein